MPENDSFPKVTICIPVRNGERTIRKTLDSLLTQDYPNCEIIVSDNCSDDDTAKIVSQYASNGVKYFFNPVLEKYGESNWNYILSLAEGPFIALYHADDLYTPTMVRRQVEFLKINPKVSAVFVMSQFINEQDQPIRWGSMQLPKKLRGRDYFNYHEFLNATLEYCAFTSVPTMMTRREVINSVGNFHWQQFKSASDIDLYLRMAKEWGPIGIINEQLHKYRISEQQGTAIINKNRTELPDYFYSIDAHLNNVKNLKYVKIRSLSLYALHRAHYQRLCAVTLLMQGKVIEAEILLKEVLYWRHFVTAYQRPRILFDLLIGLLLLISIHLGGGTYVGQKVDWAYKRKKMKDRKPIGK